MEVKLVATHLGDVGVLSKEHYENTPKSYWYTLHKHAAFSCRKNISEDWHPSAWLGCTDGKHMSTLGIFRVVDRGVDGVCILEELPEDLWDSFVNINERFPYPCKEYWVEYNAIFQRDEPLI
jgi:hypothetical protein